MPEVRRFALALLLSLALAAPAFAQEMEAGDTPQTGNVAVQPTARDDQIAERIAGILDATGWYENTEVIVADGIVFLDGITDSEAHQTWARDLSARTQDVVAVVNRIDVVLDADWSFAPAFDAMRQVAERIVTALPLVVLAMVVLPLTWWLSALAASGLRRWSLGGIRSPLLRAVLSRIIAFPIFLLGLYIVLQVAGLTQLALSVVGGAGVIGIVFGFAFRDIAENFLASLLLSIRQPFRVRDFIEVDGLMGTVRAMNTRSTILISRDGNQIQIPNAMVFKSVITNFTASPEARERFSVGIGYDAPVNDAQQIIVDVLDDHEAVLNDPPPMVLVDSLGSSTVNLVAYYWIDITEFEPVKVRSSVLRLAKKALTEAGISMPDDAREIIFPDGVPLIRPGTEQIAVESSAMPIEESSEARTDVEASLESDQDQVLDRATRADPDDDDTNLLG